MKIHKILLACLVGVTALTSCSDPMDEITSLILDRNFSPVDLEARVQQRTNIRLSWTLSSGADQYVIERYDNDSLNFDGVTATQTYTITSDEMPYTITGLEGETEYSFRVKAVTSTDASRDSKWSEAYAKTSAEQILNTVGDDDVTARSVTITWQAGEEAQNIVIKDADGNTVVDHALTADEIAAGSVTLSGLTPETEYTATMYRSNGKQRGQVTFTTPIELLDGDVLLSDGDDIATKLAEVQDGGRLIVNDGTYTVPSETADQWGALEINKSITIKGLHASTRPTIRGRFIIAGGTDIVIDQLILKGDSTTGDQAFNVTTAATYGNLSVTNSDISGYAKGLLYISVAAKFGAITFDNNIIHDITCQGGDFLDSRKGAFDALNFTNNTVYNSCAERDFVRFDNAASSFPGVSPVITIDHNTLVNVVSENTARRLLYVRFKGNKITFTNNIVAGFKGQRGFTDQANTDQSPTLQHNYYWNTENLLSAGANAAATIKWYDTSGTELSATPFQDADNADFTVTNEDIQFYGVGDPRWISQQ